MSHVYLKAVIKHYNNTYKSHPRTTRGFISILTEIDDCFSLMPKHVADFLIFIQCI